MNPERIKEAAAIFEKTGFVWVATADDKGIPHISIAKKLTVESDNMVNLTEWFCPGTVNNIDKNPAISIVSWDKNTNTGHQLIGTVINIKEVGMQDGFTGESKPAETPQVEREFDVKVEYILEFKNAPHRDKAE
ncbi:MAG: pyridoxamine 5'-phosphate oxidase family protein [Desulfurivibrionaceae bacterium]